MVWEYLILAVILACAVFFLWRTFFRNRACACGNCPSATKESCMLHPDALRGAARPTDDISENGGERGSRTGG